MKYKIKIAGLVSIFFFLQYIVLQAQSFDTKFGKNRVQYNEDFRYWSQYESENFIVYWYGKGKNIAHTVMQMAELDHEEIRKNIEHRLSDKIEILVYVDVSDLKQSNIGSEDIFISESGETKITGNKMLVYFDGNHQNLREKIKEGIASVYFSSMQFGGNFQEVVQNAVLLNFPAWYKPGFIAYAGDNWNYLIEDELRDILEKEPKTYKFKTLARKHPRVAGHSMWYYLKNNYGKSAISSLLYLTRISKNFEKSIEFVLNTRIEQVYEDWANFYKTKYNFEADKFTPLIGEELKLKNKKYIPISNLNTSPDGHQLLYTTNQLGKLKLWLYNEATKKSKLIFKQGYQNKFQETDYEYPHITWHENGNEFSYSFQKKDKIYIRKYDLGSQKTKEILLPYEYQRLYGISYIDDRYFLINAEVEGFGDLLVFDTKERETIQLTNDFYDDLDANVVKIEGKKHILFASNRTVEHILPNKLDTILPLNNYDIFTYELQKIESKEDIKKIGKSLNRITNTPSENERHPLCYKDKIYYLNAATGINNLYVSSASSGTLTNLSRNIIRHSCDLLSGKYYYTLYHAGKYKVFVADLNSMPITTPFSTQYIQAKSQSNKSVASPKPEAIQYQEIPDHLKFQSPFEDVNPSLAIKSNIQNDQLINEKSDQEEVKSNRIEPLINTLITAAGLKFRIDKLTGRMDNDVLFEGMELVQGLNNAVAQVPMGFLAKAAVTDLFEDYKVEAGVRIPTNLRGAEYFVTFDNDKKLLDKNISFYMRNYVENSEFEFIPAIISKKQILMGMYKLKYPLNLHQSLRGSGFLRFDKQYLKASEDGTFNTPSVYEKRIGLRLEYVFDNSFESAINILHGTRFKIYTDIQNQFNFELTNGFNVGFNKGLTHVIGLDARHYIPVLNYSVLAFRGTSAISMGSKKNIYYLGGVNNNIFPSFNAETVLPSGQDFAYKSNVPHLRGFDNNIRNGSRYILGNAELRVPIFKYILGKERGAAFFRNFQIVGFADAGFAWYGSSPYSSENPLNTVNIDGPLVDLNIQYFRDPLVYGFGYGIRTQILGYFLRVDLANGVETKKVLPSKLSVSVGYDF